MRSEDLKREVTTLLDDIERNIKLIETYSDRVLVSIINECRYATRHIVNTYFNDDDVISFQSAINHLKRACYDSFNILLTFQIDRIEDFRSSYVGYADNVIKFIPNYADWQTKIYDAVKLIDQQPGGSDKELLYSKLKVASEDLQNYIRILEATQDDWRIAIRNAKQKRFWWFFFSGIAALGTILGIVLTLFK